MVEDILNFVLDGHIHPDLNIRQLSFGPSLLLGSMDEVLGLVQREPGEVNVLVLPVYLVVDTDHVGGILLEK